VRAPRCFHSSHSWSFFISWYLVDRWGRRAILLSGAIVVRAPFRIPKFSSIHIFLQMGLALAATGWWMYIDVPQTPKAVVVCVVIFNAAFGYSWGPVPWLYPPEVCSRLLFCLWQLTS